MWLFSIVVWVSGYLCLVFGSLCVACGLFYLAEFAEEYSSWAKRLITHSLQVVVVIHVLLLIFENFPPKCVLVGLAAHLSYFLFLSQFPFVELLSKEVVVSCTLCAVNNYLWYHYFQDSYYTTFSIFSFFFLNVWLIPLSYFLSLTVKDSALPFGEATVDGSGGSTPKQRRNVSIFRFLQRKKADFIPTLMPAGLSKQI
eukprot:GILJ01004098.1.p1 GENE.GILJ01004098.1~~GILJ01004098.1.p1  ORF type:complete len:199 (+),score=18.01 GILJ01004098.1:91-687(+)